MAQTLSAQNTKLRISRKRIAVLIITLVALYALLTGLSGFQRSAITVRHADGLWALAAVAVFLATYGTAALTYLALAVTKLKFLPAVIIQMAAMFADRLLPAGVGAIGINYLYLRRRKHTKAQAAIVVTTSNVLGFVGHMILLGIILISGSYHVHSKLSLDKNGVLIGAGIAVVLAIVLVSWKRQLLVRFGRQFAHDLAAYRHRPGHLALALLFAMATTLMYSFVLYASAHALHIAISWPQAFIVLTAGVTGGTVIPTPGGIGGAEAGLAAGLVLSGVSDSVSITIALFYRLITHWLALAVGAVALAIASRRRYLG